jgi:hypothetical protein
MIISEKSTNRPGENHGVGIPAPKSIINPQLFAESPGIDSFIGRLQNTGNFARPGFVRSTVRQAKRRESAKQHLAKARSTEEGMTDLLWALMNTKEFILNH